LNRELVINVSELKSFIKNAIQEGYIFVSMDTLVNRLRDSESVDRCLCITLDDGYRDNLENAIPIFEEYNIPFLIFISAGLLSGEVLPWWYIIEELVTCRESVIFQGKYWILVDTEMRLELFQVIRNWILLQDQRFVDYQIYNLCKLNNFVLPSYASLFLTTADIAYLAKHPLCTLGDHTYSHRNLRLLPVSKIHEELDLNNAVLSSLGVSKPRHFALPYGFSSPSVLSCLGKHCYDTISTCDPFELSYSIRLFDSRPLLIPRLNLTGSMKMKDIRLHSAISSRLGTRNLTHYSSPACSTS